MLIEEQCATGAWWAFLLAHWDWLRKPSGSYQRLLDVIFQGTVFQ